MTASNESPLFERRTLVFVALAVALLGVALCLPFWPQDQDYHCFADDRAFLGVPSFGNVASNAPFVVIGVWGLAFLFRAGPTKAFIDSWERWPFAVFFLGVALTGFGSAYYHWLPNNDRLVWDRLPMSVAFMAFFASVIAERIHLRAGLYLLAPLVLLGVGSVVQWHLGENRGAGNLWIYAFVQFYPLIMIPFMLRLFPPRYTATRFVWQALGWYVFAKILETAYVDRGLYALGHLVSGHTLKHLAAAMGAFSLLQLLRKRQPCCQITEL